MSQMDLDKTDRKILALLQADGRMTNADLAQHISLSPSACLRRVQRLEESAVISGYVALVRQEAVGRPTSIFVEVTLKSQSEESLKAFERAVRACPDIMECYLMSGDADYLIRVNRQPCPADQVLREGDRISITPTKIEGAIS